MPITRIFYDGTPASVQRIMDIIDTLSVNNGRERLYIRGDYLNKGECIQVEDGYWWIDHGFNAKPVKHEISRKEKGK